MATSTMQATNGGIISWMPLTVSSRSLGRGAGPAEGAGQLRDPDVDEVEVGGDAWRPARVGGHDDSLGPGALGDFQVQEVAQRTGAKAVIVPSNTGGAPGVTTYFDLVNVWITELARAFGGPSAPAPGSGGNGERHPADDPALRGLHGGRRPVVLFWPARDRAGRGLRGPLPCPDGGA